MMNPESITDKIRRELDALVGVPIPDGKNMYGTALYPVPMKGCEGIAVIGDGECQGRAVFRQSCPMDDPSKFGLPPMADPMESPGLYVGEQGDDGDLFGEGVIYTPTQLEEKLRAICLNSENINEARANLAGASLSRQMADGIRGSLLS